VRTGGSLPLERKDKTKALQEGTEQTFLFFLAVICWMPS